METLQRKTCERMAEALQGLGWRRWTAEEFTACPYATPGSIGMVSPAAEAGFITFVEPDPDGPGARIRLSTSYLPPEIDGYPAIVVVTQDQIPAVVGFVRNVWISFMWGFRVREFWGRLDDMDVN
jgi:hypothetical protein